MEVGQSSEEIRDRRGSSKCDKGGQGGYGGVRGG